MNVIFFETPFGVMGAESDGTCAVSRLYFPGETVCEAAPHESFFLNGVKYQLLEYFAGVRTSFDIPLRPKGTVFQKKVWEVLTAIPYGETRSYREVAAAAGNPGAAKAVGGACRCNPIPS
jgi:methylated-DNA-[protein]-cysteine S-methyltransferase